jgi:hypothetical protein
VTKIINPFAEIQNIVSYGSDNNLPDGARYYKINLPADIPANDF